MMLDVLEVESELLRQKRSRICGLAAAVGQEPLLVMKRERGLAGDAWTHAQHATLLGRVQLNVVRVFRPWSDEAHVAPNDVPELRQLVEPGPPQRAPDARDPWIIRDGNGGPLAVRTRGHRPQLEDAKGSAFQADPFAAIEG